eukprot:8520-Heterococcus_DN1.PRE.3
MLSNGLGAECASVEEVAHALAVGFPAHTIVYDAPAKTRSAIASAAAAGIHINLDCCVEVATVAALLAERSSSDSDANVQPVFGLRVNVLVGEGAIADTSTAGRGSKFGEALTADRLPLITTAFVEHRWITAVHSHVGSQGCSLDMLVAGARALVDFALHVNAAVGHKQNVLLSVVFAYRQATAAHAAAIAQPSINQPTGSTQLWCGGLSANYCTNEPAMPGRSFSDYAAALTAAVPELFTGEFHVITEFGRALMAKAGVTLSVVAKVKDSADSCSSNSSCSSSISSSVPTAIIHTGANQFVRVAYRPSQWFHRMTVHDSSGRLRKSGSSDAPLVPHNIAGPLCFSGDFLARALPLPCIAAKDIVCIHDTGAYTTSMYSAYNSVTPAPVYMYEEDILSQGNSGSSSSSYTPQYKFTAILQRSVADTLAFWG